MWNALLAFMAPLVLFIQMYFEWTCGSVDTLTNSLHHILQVALTESRQPICGAAYILNANNEPVILTAAHCVIG